MAADSVDAQPQATLETLQSVAFDRLEAAAAVLDSEGTIVATNASWNLFSALNGGDLASTGTGVNYLDVCDSSASYEPDAEHVAAGLRSILRGDRERFAYEYACPSKAQDRWFILSATAASVINGSGLVLFHTDISARRLLEDNLKALAACDELTGLPNRRAAMEFIDRALADDDLDPIVIFFDLDGFKAVNDTYGHRAGDDVLTQVAERARRCLRSDDLLARIGGDEYVIICRSVEDPHGESVQCRLRELIGEPFQVGSEQISVGVSIGQSSSESGGSAKSLLGSADDAMYADKRRRRRRSNGR